MKQILTFLMLICFTASAQMNYKAGLLVPLPFYVHTDYLVHPSSVMLEADLQKGKVHGFVNTGYIRLKGQDMFQSIPLIFGAKYDIKDFHIGAGFGPSYTTEYKFEKFHIIYNFKAGYNVRRWTIEMNYYNWEELPDELNTLAIAIFYKL